MPKLLATILLCAAGLSLAVHAEVYKWVDAKGIAHYTDNKFEAGEAAVMELKVNGPPAQVASGPTWQQREAEFKRLQEHKLMAPAYRARAQRQPQAQSQPSYRGDKPVTDASRCDMARDIRGGKLHHINGMPVDQQDHETANSDIRAYCR